MARRSFSKWLVWGLLGLLAFSMAGFGISGLSGNSRDIGEVEGRSIRIDDYSIALQSRINAFQRQGLPVDFALAQQFGIDAEVRARLITDAGLAVEAERIGISSSDQAVAEALFAIPAFQGLDGQFDREAYLTILSRQRRQPAEFEASLRDGLTNDLLLGAVRTGVPAPEGVADIIVDFALEERDFLVLSREVDLDSEALASRAEAYAAEELRGYYDAEIDRYTAPERKQITYVWLTPSMIQDDLDWDETALMELYEDRFDQFNRPERRLVDRLLFRSLEEAEQAYAAIESGETNYDDLVLERGLALVDVEIGDVSRDELSGAAEAVFAMETGGVSPPQETEQGPALYRVNGILPASSRGFEDVRAELSEELAANRARREIASRHEELEDDLARGLSLEQVAERHSLGIGQVLWSFESEGGISDFAAFQDAASGVVAEDFPSFAELDDGGIFSLRLDELVPPAPYPFEEILSELRLDLARRDAAEEVKAELENLPEDADLVALGAEEIIELTRDGFVEGIPRIEVPALFQLREKERKLIELSEGWALAEVLSVHKPDPELPEAQALGARLNADLRATIGADIADIFTRELLAGMEVRINQAAIDAVHAQLN